MGSPEDRKKHSRRIKRKVQEKVERVRSQVAKELIVSGKYKQRIVKDKKGREHDLTKMTHKQLIDLISEE